MFDINKFWNDVINQNRENLTSYFTKDAVIRWHCTNEQFSVQEYIKVNCDYPGKWCGKIERIEKTESSVVLAGQVFSKETSASFHVVSFIKLQNNLIQELDEYWSDDIEAPDWRKQMKIGKNITQKS